MPSESIHINFAIIGYVDRTKSTTTGHLVQGELEAPIPRNWQMRGHALLTPRKSPCVDCF
ncbi:hypothetical protein GJAV_G00003510 [Gymnothorax javanicus]|nr:hypothetical protein GJAV_G00003510 [Gymnothorax javanicus]